MSFQLQINITESSNCESFYFNDATPLYNSVSAPTGYDPTGVSNFDPNDIDTDRIFLDVTLPSGNIISLTIPNTVPNVSNIGTTGYITYEITAAMLGFSNKLDDGVYKFVYKIYSLNSSLTYTTSCYSAQTCQVCCCLNQKLKEITFCSNCSEQTKTKKQQQYRDMYMLKDKADYLAACFDNVGAQEVIDFLTSYCGIKNCDSCN
tara:strand:+ start:60789 stop:61403 length:615 start_codon:yes stop_codon:yes gene_type:complete